ncbi:MAG TPA: N-acetylmuramoyl-L-alanine amidase, partial [Tepidisphaeraceae bacterium]|jgi:N-acetyl-anhydromuramyl-L-alanine amidase AmpD
MQSLAKLTAYLMRTYHISESDVIGHRDTKPTDCPGRNMNVQIVRRMADQILVDSGYRPEAGVQTASSNELLTDVPSSH